MKSEKKIPVECYSRVVGYFRPVAQWNKGMKAQFEDRKMYSLKKALSHIKEVDR
jgi:anaerobic ribonucleoside-triphosphate reductase